MIVRKHEDKSTPGNNEHSIDRDHACGHTGRLFQVHRNHYGNNYRNYNSNYNSDVNSNYNFNSNFNSDVNSNYNEDYNRNCNFDRNYCGNPGQIRVYDERIGNSSRPRSGHEAGGRGGSQGD